MGEDFRFPSGQVGLHRELRFRQIQRLFVVHSKDTETSTKWIDRKGSETGRPARALARQPGWIRPAVEAEMLLIGVTLEAYLCKIGNREITLALGASGMAYALWRTRMRSQESHEMVF
jgi:hypothetical protein